MKRYLGYTRIFISEEGMALKLIADSACDLPKELAEKNMEKNELICAIQYHCDHMKHIFTVDTLEYLLKGGRISRSSAFVGEILDIKPIIKVDENGTLQAIGRVRGRKRSMQRLVKYVGENGTGLNQQIIGLVHGDDFDMLQEVKKSLKESYGITKTIDSYVGCAIGAHTGPGIIGITFLDVPSKYDI